MKYVILQHPQNIPVIAAGCGPSHLELAESYLAKGYKATSAGFMRCLPDGRFQAWGGSESLKLATHPDDARVLQAFHMATVRVAPKPETEAD